MIFMTPLYHTYKQFLVLKYDGRTWNENEIESDFSMGRKTSVVNLRTGKQVYRAVKFASSGKAIDMYFDSVTRWGIIINDRNLLSFSENFHTFEKGDFQFENPTQNTKSIVKSVLPHNINVFDIEYIDHYRYRLAVIEVNIEGSEYLARVYENQNGKLKEILSTVLRRFVPQQIKLKGNSLLLISEIGEVRFYSCILEKKVCKNWKIFKLGIFPLIDIDEKGERVFLSSRKGVIIILDGKTLSELKLVTKNQVSQIRAINYDRISGKLNIYDKKGSTHNINIPLKPNFYIKDTFKVERSEVSNVQQLNEIIEVQRSQKNDSTGISDYILCQLQSSDQLSYGIIKVVGQKLTTIIDLGKTKRPLSFSIDQKTSKIAVLLNNSIQIWKKVLNDNENDQNLTVSYKKYVEAKYNGENRGITTLQSIDNKIYYINDKIHLRVVDIDRF